jgi:urea transport system permease protein
LSLLLKATPLGRRIRGVVQNRDLAETVGISTRSTDRLTFFIGSGLAGIAGVALTLLGSTGPTLGTSYIVDAFLVVVAGGIGQIRGAVIAAFGLGLLQATFEYSTTASIAKVMVFVVIVVFLQIRPQGIFSVRTRSLA